MDDNQGKIIGLCRKCHKVMTCDYSTDVEIDFHSIKSNKIEKRMRRAGHCPVCGNVVLGLPNELDVRVATAIANKTFEVKRCIHCSGEGWVWVDGVYGEAVEMCDYCNGRGNYEVDDHGKIF